MVMEQHIFVTNLGLSNWVFVFGYTRYLSPQIPCRWPPLHSHPSFPLRRPRGKILSYRTYTQVEKNIHVKRRRDLLCFMVQFLGNTTLSNCLLVERQRQQQPWESLNIISAFEARERYTYAAFGRYLKISNSFHSCLF